MRDRDKGLKVIETERSPIAPRAGMILEWSGEVVEKNEPFSLEFSQIVALMLPYCSVLAGLLLVAILIPPWFELKVSLSRKEERHRTDHRENTRLRPEPADREVHAGGT